MDYLQMIGKDSKGSRIHTRAKAVLVVAVVLAVLAGSAAGTVAAQTNATETATATATATQTATQSACEPGPNEPQLSQSRLYAPQQTIESGEPGQIAGGFQVAADASCPVVVSITMSVPSGMTISGASDVVSSGAGLATAQFRVSPGEIQDIRANVYSQNTGDRSVTADITYWPEGNQDMSREIDGISLTFDVQDPVTPGSDGGDGGNDNSTGGANGSNGGLLSNTMLLAFGGFALVVLAIVAVATRSDGVKIGISK